MRLVLVGNYGDHNLGDEMLRSYFLRTFPEHNWTIVSARPNGANEVPRLPFGIRSFFRPWWKTIDAIKNADALIYGGGSLFTDTESWKAPVLWWTYAVLARMFRKRIILAFQGVGPFRTGIGMWCSRSAIEHAHFVSVRDPHSLARIKSWNLKTDPTLSSDPAILEFARTHAAPESGHLVIIPRSNSTEIFLRAAERLISGDWERVTVLLMQASDRDRVYAQRLMKIAEKYTVEMREPTSQDDFLQIVGSAAHVLSQRYHGALAAIAMGIPCEIIPQEVGDKLSSLLETDGTAMMERVRMGENALREALVST